MNSSQKYDSPIASIVHLGNFYFVFKLKNTDIAWDEEEIKNQFDYFYIHTEGKPYRILLDARDSLNLPTEKGHTYFSLFNRPEGKTAILTNNLPMHLFMTQILKYSKIKNVKVFKDEKKANDWLMTDDI